MKIQINNDENIKKRIELGLHQYNKKHCHFIQEHSNGGGTECERYHFIAYHEENRVIGGGVGFIQYDWYYLESLWVNSENRRQGIGTYIMKAIETMALQKNLVGIRMETWDFQAKEFYEKNGYDIYATLPNCPRGSTIYFLKKELL